MTFLAPALLAGLIAIAIPIVVHLVQRERRTVQPFPSLMFLRRIPNQSVRRRAIRHWPLLALRILALALVALAFARPFLSAKAVGPGADGGSRDVVVLLDRSASMGYGGHWARAQEAARRVVNALGPGDSGAVVFFESEVEVAGRSEAGPGTLLAAIDRAHPGGGPTRFGPALRSAAGLFDTTSAARREIVLISDFQKSGWDAGQDLKLPPGVSLATVSVAEPAAANAALVGLTFEQQQASKGMAVTASARVVNHGTRAVTDREITLDVDGHRVGAASVSVPPGVARTVAFAPFAVAATSARVVARLAPDALPADDVFHAMVSLGGQVPILILESPNAAPGASLYLARALEVGAAPGFDARVVHADRVTPADVNRAAVIVLNDTRPPSGAAARSLASAVHDGAGLLVVLGERSAWTEENFDLLPGKLGQAVDRSAGGAGSVASVDFSHPAFEIFSSPRSGDLSAARVFRYRALAEPARVLARFDDGGVALAERRVGRGTVVAWTSTFDSQWNDLPLKPVFVPFVHRLMQYLGRYVEPRQWYSVGDTFDPSDQPPREAGRAAAVGAFTALSPSAKPVEPLLAAGTRTVPLLETGFYEIRPASASSRAGRLAPQQQVGGEASASPPIVVAVNGVPGESDLSPIDPEELKARVISAAGRTPAQPGHEIGIEERERRQSLWWYLLLAGLVLLVVEAAVASRLPRIA